MTFPDVQARLTASVFERLGDDAVWQDVPGTVRVLRRVADEELRLSAASIVETGVTIRVRKADIADPQEGQQVQLLDGSGSPFADGLYVLNGTPELDRKGVWHCRARMIP